MAVAAAIYMVFAAWMGYLFLRSGSLAAALLGIAVMVLPLLGLWMIWQELQFGMRVQNLADELGVRGELPVDDLERTPSGRITREAAAAEFEAASTAVAGTPDDPAAWFRVSLAYEAGRDRKRARAAMRYAVALADGSAGAPPDLL